MYYTRLKISKWKQNMFPLPSLHKKLSFRLANLFCLFWNRRRVSDFFIFLFHQDSGSVHPFKHFYISIRIFFWEKKTEMINAETFSSLFRVDITRSHTSCNLFPTCKSQSRIWINNSNFVPFNWKSFSKWKSFINLWQFRMFSIL